MKTTDDYKDKIRKLLALAQSPNEHEARAALLKARQLMAEHKLSEAELRDPVKQEGKDERTDRHHLQQAPESVDYQPVRRHRRKLLLQGIPNT